MPSGSYTVSTWPHERVTLACTLCGRHGSYAKATLLSRYGDIAMPDLLQMIAADAGCDLARNPTNIERCRAVYPAPPGNFR